MRVRGMYSRTAFLAFLANRASRIFNNLRVFSKLSQFDSPRLHHSNVFIISSLRRSSAPYVPGRFQLSLVRGGENGIASTRLGLAGICFFCEREQVCTPGNFEPTRSGRTKRENHSICGSWASPFYFQVPRHPTTNRG